MAWIEKRGNKYRVNWEIGTPEKRERRVVSFDTSEEADQYKKKVEYELSIGTFIDLSKMTLSEYLDHWLRLHGEKLAPMTFNSYEHQIRNHIKPNLGKIKLSKLSPMHLQDYYSRALKEGRLDSLKIELDHLHGTDKKTIKKRKKIEKRIEKSKSNGTAGLSPTSINYQHRIIHKALKQAVKWQMVARNAADAVDPPQKTKAHVSYLGKEQLNMFLACITSSPDYPVIAGAVLTGMRRGELLGLRWSAVDLNIGIIHVREQLQYLPNQGYFFKEPKQHSQRTIPIPLPLNSILRKVAKEQDRLRGIFGDDYKDMGLVFCNPNGSPLEGTGLTKRFQKLLVSNNLGKIRFHALRHTFATMARAAGVPIEDIQDLLGHADISTTKSMYTHVEIEPLRNSMDKLAEYLAN